MRGQPRGAGGQLVKEGRWAFQNGPGCREGGRGGHSAHLLSIQLCSRRKPKCARLSSRLSPSSCT